MSGVTSRLARWCSILALIACVATGFIVLLAKGESSAWAFGFRGSLTVFSAPFAFAGALIAFRRPSNQIGSIFSVSGLVMAVDAFALEYPSWIGPFSSGPWPDRALAAWLANWLWVPGLMLTAVLLFVLFPDGHPPSPRWRVVIVGAVAGCTVVAVARALTPGVLGMYPSIVNPLSADIRWLLRLEDAGWRLLLASLVLGVAATVRRWRRANRTLRQQLKWFASAAALFTAGFVAQELGVTSGYLPIAILIAAASVPGAVTVAILRYRLYDIDRIISRTLTYALVTGGLLGTYIGLVVLFQLTTRPFTGGSDLAVAASVLIVAAAFRPARRRVQSAVDRRFNRASYDAAQTIEAFSARLRDEIDIDALGAELQSVVDSSLHPAHVSLWLTTAKP